jgi:hypothetical protein
MCGTGGSVWDEARAAIRYSLCRLNGVIACSQRGPISLRVSFVVTRNRPKCPEPAPDAAIRRGHRRSRLKRCQELALLVDATWLTGKSKPYLRSGSTDAFVRKSGLRGANENSANTLGIRGILNGHLDGWFD